MQNLFKNPFSIWLARLIQSKILEYKNRKKHLKIGYMAYVTNSNFGRYNTLYEKVVLKHVILDDFTYVAESTHICHTTIGKFCSIGADCRIGLGKHPSATFVSSHPIFFSAAKQAQVSFADKSYFNEYENITIGNDVWVGANAIVMDGVNIADGAIIAAGSVVTKDVPAYAVAGGVPARIIRYRFNKKEISRLLELKWWNMDFQYLKNNFKKFHNIENFLE
ncbi:CatB-related O-acetyltransferase [Sulfurovum sp.]|uniref:CatB-related O-acetyltransferase n=1 Tax=Sulfurovum sp. TaxID=1969726 RepID=UPI003564B92F